MPKSKSWKAFLPLGTLIKSAEAPAADPLWLATKGIEPDAQLVLRAVRQEVLPLVRKLQTATREWTIDFGKLPKHRRGAGYRSIPKLVAFHFLVHDRTSGVPCPAEDAQAYIDLSLWFEKPVDISKMLPHCWAYVRPRGEDLPKQIAGVKGSVATAVELTNEQSAWYLRLVENFRDEKDDLEVLKQVRQFLHYFANMAQMRIS